jgi:hypothetical protein
VEAGADRNPAPGKGYVAKSDNNTAAFITDEVEAGADRIEAPGKGYVAKLV